MDNKVKHLAIVLDGNRRYAKARGKLSHEGHESGAETLEKFLKWCRELEIKETTIYALSTENLKRDKIELSFLFRIMEKWFKKLLEDKSLHEDKIQVKFIGDLSLLPASLRELCLRIEEKTKDYKNYKLNFCVAYGGRLEITNTFNKLKDKKDKITEEDITNALWLKSEPDLIIRTGDSVRTSNFLPWQTVYSEWIFLKKMWPEITKEDLVSALNEFDNRKRNFGK